MTARHRNHRPWFDEESKMTRKNVRRLEHIFQRCRSTESRDSRKSAPRQSRRMSCSKSSAYWKWKISADRSDARTTLKSVSTVLGERKSSAVADFSAQEYLDFIVKKVDGIREATSS